MATLIEIKLDRREFVYDGEELVVFSARVRHSERKRAAQINGSTAQGVKTKLLQFLADKL